MSTVDKFRYLLAAASALLGVGLIAYDDVFVGILCFVTSILFLPILYRLLLIKSNEVQFVSPLVFVAVTLFSYVMLNVVAVTEEAPLKTQYIPAEETTVVSTTSTQAVTTTMVTTTTTQASSELIGTVVYRTPSGSRYHLNPDCGGDNSYEVPLEQAVESGLTPCKKCAGD